MEKLFLIETLSIETATTIGVTLDRGQGSERFWKRQLRPKLQLNHLLSAPPRMSVKTVEARRIGFW
jgi:hypothetical protein